MNGLGDVIAAQLERWGGADLALERQLFGTTDPDGIADAVDGWCRTHLGAAVAQYVFFYSSVGSVHGVGLSNRRRVVVKGHRPEASAHYLAAMLDVQHDLAASGYPAPRPLVGPSPCGAGHITAETLLAQRTPADAHAPEVIELLARGLVEFVAQAMAHRERLAVVTHPMALTEDALYPRPHSARFDFEATAEGAEWIDELAAGGRARIAALPAPEPVLTHGDWRVENVSVSDGRIVAVYDWDSVAVMDEVVAVGAAALTFPIDWEREQPRRFPWPYEMAEFVQAYEAARSRSFTATERRRLAASMVASLAYGARCEHADRDRPPAGDDSQRGLLATLGPALLADGLDALRAR